MVYLLVTAGASHVMTMTLHSPQVHGFLGVPTDQRSTIRVLAEHLRILGTPSGQRTSPVRLVGPVAAASRQRIDDLTVRVEGIIVEVRGKPVILIDDEVAAGGSIQELVRVLRGEGVLDVTVACTHGVFSGPAVDRLSSMSEVVEVVTTDTVPVSEGILRRLPNVTVLSVAAVFREAIHRNVLGLPVGPLFAS